MKKGITYIVLVGIAISLSSCSGKKDKPSIVFMPDMYYPVAYDPYVEADFGYWPERTKGKSEIPLFADYDNMTSLWPAHGTVARTDEQMILPWEFENTMEGYNQSLGIRNSPLDPANRAKDLEHGEKLYGQTCATCHGAKGDGQGPIVQSKAYSGVPTYDERDITIGSVYHVIMYGKNAMGSYAPQLNPVDRWRVAEYVMKLKGVDTSASTSTQTSTNDELPIVENKEIEESTELDNTNQQ